MVLAAFSKFEDFGVKQASAIWWARFPRRTAPIPATLPCSTKSNSAKHPSEGLFLRSNLTALPINNSTHQRLTFPNGAIDLKSSWIDMTNVQHPERYYTRIAWGFDPFTPTPTCAQITVGLVGLHIVQKTTLRPQWIS